MVCQSSLIPWSWWACVQHGWDESHTRDNQFPPSATGQERNNIRITLKQIKTTPIYFQFFICVFLTFKSKRKCLYLVSRDPCADKVWWDLENREENDGTVYARLDNFGGFQFFTKSNCQKGFWKRSKSLFGVLIFSFSTEEIANTTPTVG